MKNFLICSKIAKETEEKSAINFPTIIFNSHSYFSVVVVIISMQIERKFSEELRKKNRKLEFLWRKKTL